MSLSGREAAIERRRQQSRAGKGSSAARRAVARQPAGKASGRELARARREALSETGAAGAPETAPGESGAERPCDCGCKGQHGDRKPAPAAAPNPPAGGKIQPGGRLQAMARRRAQSRSGQTGAGGEPATGPDSAALEPGLTGRAAAQALRARRSRSGRGAAANRAAPEQPGPATSETPAAAPPAPPARAITGTSVRGGHRITGDESGGERAVTGTEYVGPGGARERRPTGTADGMAVTTGRGGQSVTGSIVGRSDKVTGDEAGSERQPTGTRYQEPGNGAAPAKVGLTRTFRGATVSGTRVGRSMRVTGDEAGSCKRITGNEYVGSEQYREICATRPPMRAPAARSATPRGGVLTGSLTGRGERVTGNEPGTCKAVTGTPYDGVEQVEALCDDEARADVAARTPRQRMTPGARLTGQQPGISGPLTGAERGACEPVTGTPYVGEDQFADTCGTGQVPAADHDAPWTAFSVTSPARAAMARVRVDGHGSAASDLITGPFGMAHGKITGTDDFGTPAGESARSAASPAPTRPAPAFGAGRPRITGEGLDAGLKITGDDWDRGDRVTGTEGSSSTVRNPTRRGGPMSAMPRREAARHGPQDVPESPVTGGVGATTRGALVTVSGGARG